MPLSITPSHQLPRYIFLPPLICCSTVGIAWLVNPCYYAYHLQGVSTHSNDLILHPSSCLHQLHIFFGLCMHFIIPLFGCQPTTLVYAQGQAGGIKSFWDLESRETMWNYIKWKTHWLLLNVVECCWMLLQHSVCQGSSIIVLCLVLQMKPFGTLNVAKCCGMLPNIAATFSIPKFFNSNTMLGVPNEDLWYTNAAQYCWVVLNVVECCWMLLQHSVYKGSSIIMLSLVYQIWNFSTLDVAKCCQMLLNVVECCCNTQCTKVFQL